MQVLYSSEFVKRFKRLSANIKELAKEKEKIFRKDPFDASLKTHKLHGKFGDFWGFSVNFECRIIFKFEENGTVKFYSIGGHAIYK